MLISAQNAHSHVSSVSSVSSVSIDSIALTPQQKFSELCIISDGVASLAVASILASAGHSVRLWTDCSGRASLKQFIERLPLEYEMRERGASVSHFRRKTEFDIVTDDLKVGLKVSEGVIISKSVTEYGALAQKLAPALSNGQTIILHNAPLGGGLQFKQLMRKARKDLQLNIIEVGRVFDSATIEGNVLLINGLRDKVAFCGNTRNETRRGLSIANTISQGLVPASNVIERGLLDTERVLRPVFLLFALLGGRGRELDSIASLVNQSLTKLITSLDSEIQSVAKMFHCVVPTFFDALTHFGGVGWDDADTIDQALISLADNLLSRSSHSVEGATEQLRLDICETFALLSDFARLSRTHTPVINSVIELATVISRVDVSRLGRSVSDLGLLGYDVEEIVELINA